MKDNNFKLNFRISADVRVMFTPIVVLLVLLLMFVFTVRESWRQIDNKLDAISESERVSELLEEKLSVLREVEERVLEASNESLLSVPSRNPVVWSYLQLTQMFREEGVSVEEVSIGERIGSGNTRKRTSSYVVTGGLSETEDVLENIHNLAPIMYVDSYELKEGVDSYTLSFKVNITDVSLPEFLPAITAPVRSFTAKENEILAILTELEKPDFTTLDPQINEDRINPF